MRKLWEDFKFGLGLGMGLICDYGLLRLILLIINIIAGSARQGSGMQL